MARRNRNAYAAKWSKELTLLIPKGRGFSAQRPLPASRSYMGRQWSANRESPGFRRGECQEILWSEYAGWDFVKTCERCPRDLPELCERRERGTL